MLILIQPALTKTKFNHNNLRITKIAFISVCNLLFYAFRPFICFYYFDSSDKESLGVNKNLKLKKVYFKLKLPAIAKRKSNHKTIQFLKINENLQFKISDIN